MDSNRAIEWGVRGLISRGVLRNHEVASRLGILVIDLQVLNLIAIAGGRATPSQLAQQMSTPRPTVTRIVRRLEEGGYVTRSESPLDRRSVTVEINPERMESVTAQYRQQSEHLARTLTAFSPDEVAVVARFLQALLGGATT